MRPPPCKSRQPETWRYWSVIMLGTLTKQLNCVDEIANQVERTYPEDVLFATAATVLETGEPAPVGWYFKRLFQRRVVAVFTRNQVILTSTLRSFLTLVYVFLIVGSLIIFFATQQLMVLLVGIVAGLLILQRLPYTKHIPMGEMKEIHLSAVRGISGKGSLLTIYLDNHAINIVTAKPLPDPVRKTLASYVDHEVVMQLTRS